MGEGNSFVANARPHASFLAGSVETEAIIPIGPGNETDVRRFGCTSCGKCCVRGPEMELGEATALAGTFITSIIFKVHSIPMNVQGDQAKQWWRAEGSRIPLLPALQEKRRHLAQFASRRRSDRRNDREIYVTISAIVDDYGNGKCPALKGNLCSIYAHRPMTCRTVPLHYSRQPSALKSYVDQFTSMPGHECDTQDSPVILDGSRIVVSNLADDRSRAVEIGKADRIWKGHILSIMDDPDAARRFDLPTYPELLANSDNGFATLLPMIVAWRVAASKGLMTWETLRDICKQQIALIRAEPRNSPSGSELHALLPLYEAGSRPDGS